jgi:predicted enzyme related to lactoylglutathione lyase
MREGMFNLGEQGRRRQKIHKVRYLPRGSRADIVAAMGPTFGNGKICYVELPATDVARSAEFYATVFGWKIRTRGDGSTSFDDGVNQVSGAFILGRAAHGAKGLMVHIMVDDINKSIAAVVANGGTIVQPVGADAPEFTAQFRDPAGNVMRMYQHRG